MTIMYHDDHLTDSEKDTWSGLYLLADVAVMVEEEEQRLRRLAEKGSEESFKCHKKGFFCRFPRKTRSSLVKRRYTQQNPNGTSTSSSSLTDYETKTSQNPSFDEPMVYDAKKGKAKIVCEDDDDGERDEERLFLKNVKRFVRQNFHNLDGASTSSSFLNLRCHEPSLLLYNMAKSEKTGMKDDPPNPNYQLENTSRKRCAVQQKNKSCNFKKAKVADPFPRMATETPEWIYQVMTTMKADAEEPWLIFERFLSARDVKTDQSRLLIPFKKLIRNDFLTPAECRAIKKDETNQNEDENIGVGTILVNQRSEKWGLRFKIWPMEKDSGRGTLYYILNWGWNEVVKGNDLKADDKIRLWTFRCRGVLCFALETY